MENRDALYAIDEIRTLMKRSSKFLSLSGLSSILVGVYALVVSAIAFWLYGNCREIGDNISLPVLNVNTPTRLRLFVLLALILLIVSLATVAILTRIKVKKEGGSLSFDHTVRRFLFNFFLPLVVGGCLCVALLMQQHYGLTSSVMLIFYGLALVNASSYTYSHTRYLGYVQIILGVANSFLMGYGYLFWILGFGIAHIGFGILFWWNFERERK